MLDDIAGFRIYEEDGEHLIENPFGPDLRMVSLVWAEYTLSALRNAYQEGSEDRRDAINKALN